MVKEWHIMKLGDIFDFKNGLNKEKIFFGSGTPIVNYMDVYQKSGLKKADIKGSVTLDRSEIDRYEVRKGDVFFTRTSETPDEVGIASILLEEIEDCVFSGFVLRARPKKDVLLPEYCKYCFSTDKVRKEIITNCTYTTRALTNGKQLSAIEIPVPDKKEQAKIATALSDIDNLISESEKLIRKYQAMKQGCLRHMFPRKGQTEPDMRLPGFSGAWEQRKFAEIAKRESSFRSSSYENPSVEYEDVLAEEGRLIKDIRMKEIKKTGIGFDGTQVLYGKLRPYLHNWLNPDFEGVAVGDWWVLKPVKMDKNFLYRLIQTRKFDEISNQSIGSKMPRADWNLVSNAEFSIPFSLDEQKKIAGVFDNLDNLIILHQRKCEKYKMIKQGMMEDLLTGKVRLK